MTFTTLRDSIKACHECKMTVDNNPILFNCKRPKDVKIIVITEQPKDTKEMRITEETIISDFFRMKRDQNKGTKGALIEILKEDFLDSIKYLAGPFYWTHHTKCSSEKSEIKKICMKKWFYNEIIQFENAKLIISFGTEAFNAIMEINSRNIKFIDYFWEEILHFITGKGEFYKVYNKQFIALPHPSKANPLSNLIGKIEKYIEIEIEKAKETA